MKHSGPGERRAFVVGFGNTLRGDDGLGPYTVESLQGPPLLRNLAIRTIVLPQLDVSLAAEMSEADLLVLVDARSDEDEELVKVERVVAPTRMSDKPHTSHAVGVPDLLHLLREWYGSTPTCYTVMPKGYDFSIGDVVSEKARLAATEARARVVEILASAF